MVLTGERAHRSHRDRWSFQSLRRTPRRRPGNQAREWAKLRRDRHGPDGEPHDAQVGPGCLRKLPPTIRWPSWTPSFGPWRGPSCAREGLPPLSDETLAQLRRGGPVNIKPLLPEIPVSERRIPGPEGSPEVTLYLINTGRGARGPPSSICTAVATSPAPRSGSCRNLQELAAELDCAIVSVDYRLAPETRYSGSVEDNYAGLRWVYAHAAELGIDPRRIAVMGESAGGGHAALLAQALRDRGEVPVLFQALLYPMLDDRTGSTGALFPRTSAHWSGRPRPIASAGAASSAPIRVGRTYPPPLSPASDEARGPPAGFHRRRLDRTLRR